MKTTTEATDLRPAATAIVLREHAGEIQVLMTRRHASLAFMGGMWVFPGGALSAADQSDDARSVLRHPERAHELCDLTGAGLPRETCVGLAIAACRETFEEAGVLVATQCADGSEIDAVELSRIQAARSQVAADAQAFIAMLRREHFLLDPSQLVYWAHWVTPSGVPRRFDTRFFLARAPSSHAFAADTYETTECVWMRPELLLERAARDEMKIAQPTRYNLAMLAASAAAHGSLDAMLHNEATRRVPVVMPKLVKDAARTMIVMPWDPAYPTTPGDGTEPQQFDAALVELPSRVERDH